MTVNLTFVCYKEEWSSDRIRQRERRALETVVERRVQNREKHRQTRTTLTDQERTPANI